MADPSMTTRQAAKELAQAQYRDLARATPDTVAEILARRMSSTATWCGVHPFDTPVDPAGAASLFWAPFLRSFSGVQRREDIFFAGLNEIDGFTSTWVVSMGHLVGLFDAPWLRIGLPPEQINATTLRTGQKTRTA